MTDVPDGLEPALDPSDVRSTLGDIVQLGNERSPEGWRVRTMVPGVYEAYVRVLHPAWEESRRRAYIPWSAIAAANGANLEGTVAFRRITVPPATPIPKGPQGAWDEDAMPRMGTLPEEETAVLLALLPPSSHCWFLVWDGWSGLRLTDEQVTVNWQGNQHLVYRGPIRAVRRSEWTGRWQTPHLWLPEDRAWCVGTEIDGLETYVAGSQELVAHIRDEARLETLEVGPDDIAVMTGDWLMTD
jgi:hypothetical protein